MVQISCLSKFQEFGEGLYTAQELQDFSSILLGGDCHRNPDAYEIILTRSQQVLRACQYSGQFGRGGCHLRDEEAFLELQRLVHDRESGFGVMKSSIEEYHRNMSDVVDVALKLFFVGIIIGVLHPFLRY